MLSNRLVLRAAVIGMAIAIAGTAAAGCGSDPISIDAAGAVRSYFRQFATGDITAACSRLTESAANELIDRTGGFDCESSLAEIRESLSADILDLYLNTTVRRISFQSSDGYVEIADDDIFFGDVQGSDVDYDSRPITLSAIRGQWFITSFG